MFFKTILCLFMLLTGVQWVSTEARTSSPPEECLMQSEPDDDYVYEYVWIDGIRWVYVYTQDGAFVNCYPEE